ncbi:MAG TPA: ATP-binding protein [Phycisphaerae bacterium]
MRKIVEERDQLRLQLATKVSEIEGLNAELAETNKGVVALYSELDEQAEQLRETTELKSRFLAYMSHEFRTPLGSMVSISRILLSRLDGPLSPEQEKQAKFILDAATELTQMVNDLLDLAKVEAGKISISPSWFEMVNLFGALRGMFKPLLTEDSVPLIFEEPVDIPRVYSDDRKLSQILRNFISNAMKFTEKGEIRVTAVLGINDTVVFSVRDTGIGIAKEHQAALFRDYVQVDSPVQKRWRGIGLGLSLSKQLANLLGGTITVESEPGKGSTFSIHIPLFPTGVNAAQRMPEGTL